MILCVILCVILCAARLQLIDRTEARNNWELRKNFGETDMANIMTDADFTQIRKDKGCYVDKTWFIEHFLQNPDLPGNFRVSSKVTLFTRPRRFGKSLFLNMLAEFFDNQKDSKEIFSGLQVSTNEKLCQEWMNKYPLIFLNFKDETKQDFATAISSIWLYIRKLCNLHKYLLTSERVDDDDKYELKKFMKLRIDEDILKFDIQDSQRDRLIDSLQNTLRYALQILTNALACHYEKKVILLIDEYDVPLTSAWKNNYYEKMINFMSEFYSRALKDNNALRFAILTGVLRVVKASIFSGLNNLECYDISEELYADLFGFTQEEVDSLLAKAGLEDKRDIIREWYDGYHFGDRTDIYNPWSIMQYLKILQQKPQKVPKSYWVNISSNDLVIDFIRELVENETIRAKLFALRGGNPIAAKINPEMTYRDIFAEADNLWTLLYLSGYLTDAKDPAGYPRKVDTDETILVVPNREIATIFERELNVWIDKLLPKEKRDALFDALWEQNVQAFEMTLNGLLVGSGVQDQKELYYHGMMFGILRLGYKEVVSSGEGGMGFYDLLVVDRESSRAAVLELKRVASANELEQYAGKALKQIEDRSYDARVRAEGSCKTILHVGIAFCDKKAKVLFKDASA